MDTAKPFNYIEHFSRDTRVMSGQVVFKGTRVPLRMILSSLADGDTPEVLLKSFPSLTPDHLRAAIAFAAASARDDTPLLPLPSAA